MNTRVLIKEGRPLFWPWCAVMLTGLISLIRPLPSIGWIGLLGCVLGIPLLATLPFGNEFQNRTFSLLLSQPVGRLRIWVEKSCLAFVAVASVALVFAFSPLVAQTVPDRAQQANAVALIVAVVASATFWTLIARSTIGGIALSVGSVLIIDAISSAAAGMGANSLLVMTHYTTISVAILCCYAGLMLWLGERTLARYQVTGNMAGDDLLTTGSNVLLDAFSHRARSNPRRPVWNLIHKELRLLRPLWVLTVLSALAWTCYAFIALLRQGKSVTTLPLTVVATGASCAVIVTILAGCLSLGEEKTSGTYAWHRTLPISPARQWSIKLLVALFVSFICAGLVPVLLLAAGKHFFPSALSTVDAKFQLIWLLAALSLTLLSFWCACAVNGTVTAVVWAVPILAVLAFVPALGSWTALRLVDALALKFDLFANFRFTVFLSSFVRDGVTGYHTIDLAANRQDPLLFSIPSLILAVLQSYRMFRAPIRQSASSVARKLWPLVALVILCSICADSLWALSNWSAGRMFNSLYDVQTAIEKLLSDSANRNAAQPLQLDIAGLQKSGFHLSGRTLRWVENARFTIVPDKVHPTTCCPRSSVLPRILWNFTGTARLASGAVLTLSLEPPADRPDAPPDFKVRVRWPGQTSDHALIGR